MALSLAQISSYTAFAVYDSLEDAGEVAEARRIFNERVHQAEKELEAAAAGQKVPSQNAAQKLCSIASIFFSFVSSKASPLALTLLYSQK